MDDFVSVDTLVVSLLLVVAIPAGEHQAPSSDIRVRPVFSWVQQVVAVRGRQGKKEEKGKRPGQKRRSELFFSCAS